VDLKAFQASLNAEVPPPELAPALQALWYEAKDDWQHAHEMVQAHDDQDCAWVHAYLHRKEGDLGNAAYWYRRAHKPVTELSLREEWDAIVRALLM